MRTFKNVIVKSIGLVFLSFISFSAIGQTAQNVELNQRRDDHNVRLYVSPFNTINPLGNSLQVTAGKSLWKQGELQLSVSQRLGKGNPLLLEGAGGLSVLSFDASYVKGTRLGLEVQQMFHRTEDLDFYVGIEGAYSRDEILVEELTVLWVLPLDVNETIIKNTSTVNVKVGLKVFTLNNFIIDFYVGAGVRNHKFVQDIFTDFERTRSLNLPWNIKFGYQF